MSENSENKQGKVLVYIAASLDGFIAGEGGDVSWLNEFQLENQDYGYKEFIDTISRVVLGFNSYQKVLTFPEWPYEQKVYVLTHKDLPKTNPDVEFYAGEIESLITDLKQKAEKNIYVDGGAMAIQSFLKLDLIDEMTITTMPVILGKGIHLFDSLGKNIKLDLFKSKAFKNGVVQLSYKLL